MWLLQVVDEMETGAHYVWFMGSGGWVEKDAYVKATRRGDIFVKGVTGAGSFEVTFSLDTWVQPITYKVEAETQRDAAEKALGLLQKDVEDGRDFWGEALRPADPDQKRRTATVRPGRREGEPRAGSRGPFRYAVFVSPVGGVGLVRMQENGDVHCDWPVVGIDAHVLARELTMPVEQKGIFLVDGDQMSRALARIALREGVDIDLVEIRDFGPWESGDEIDVSDARQPVVCGTLRNAAGVPLSDDLGCKRKLTKAFRAMQRAKVTDGRDRETDALFCCEACRSRFLHKRSR